MEKKLKRKPLRSPVSVKTDEHTERLDYAEKLATIATLSKSFFLLLANLAMFKLLVRLQLGLELLCRT